MYIYIYVYIHSIPTTTPQDQPLLIMCQNYWSNHLSRQLHFDKFKVIHRVKYLKLMFRNVVFRRGEVFLFRRRTTVRNVSFKYFTL